jgi:hypothetical protein
MVNPLHPYNYTKNTIVYRYSTLIIFFCLRHQAINPQASLKQATLKQPSSNSKQSVASWLIKQLNPTATDCLSCLLTSVAIASKIGSIVVKLLRVEVGDFWLL